jgi:hypothetical protein
VHLDAKLSEVVLAAMMPRVPHTPTGYLIFYVSGVVSRPMRSRLKLDPGTATRRLLELGANPLVAIEPDRRLATFLRESIPNRALRVVDAPFEEVELGRPALSSVSAPPHSIGWRRM